MDAGQPTPDQAAERYAEAVAVRVAAATHLRLGEFRQALTALATAREIFAHLGEAGQEAWTMGAEGRVLDVIDRGDEAVRRLGEAEATLRRVGDQAGAGILGRRRGDVLRRRGQPDGAAACYDEAVALLRESGAALALASTLSARAELRLVRQDADGAGTDLSEALGLRPAEARPDADGFLLYARATRWAVAAGKAEAQAHAERAAGIASDLDLMKDRSDPDVAANLRLLGEAKAKLRTGG